MSFPIVEINAKSKLPKIVFVAGFPDNQTSGWGHVLPGSLADGHHMIFLCLPGYDLGGNIRPWGYSFEELVDNMHATIVPLLSSPDEKFMLVSHDWGAVLSFQYLSKYGSFVSKFVCFDVGMVDVARLPVKQVFILVLYQLWYAASYVLSQYLSNTIGNLFLAIFFLPLFRPIQPVYEKVYVPIETITAEKCYPYYYFWKAIFSGKLPKLKFPSCPTLFMVSG
jgi:pimeloyl-ACP methyl ester carboxylesterase